MYMNDPFSYRIGLRSTVFSLCAMAEYEEIALREMKKMYSYFRNIHVIRIQRRIFKTTTTKTCTLILETHMYLNTYFCHIKIISIKSLAAVGVGQVTCFDCHSKVWTSSAATRLTSCYVKARITDKFVVQHPENIYILMFEKRFNYCENEYIYMDISLTWFVTIFRLDSPSNIITRL